jgi:putative oxidoreductase
MQRLFSTFANGWPGTGLLIQRLLIGMAFFHYGVTQLEQTHRVAIFAPSLIEALAGILLILGLGTPVASALAALTDVWSIFWHRGDLWIAIILATFATSLSMIGPGAWSIDAYLFGRKRMKIP